MVSVDLFDIIVDCNELVLLIPGNYGSDDSVCEEESVCVAGGGLSETLSSGVGGGGYGGLARGPLDTESPAG